MLANRHLGPHNFSLVSAQSLPSLPSVGIPPVVVSTAHDADDKHAVVVFARSRPLLPFHLPDTEFSLPACGTGRQSVVYATDAGAAGAVINVADTVAAQMVAGALGTAGTNHGQRICHRQRVEGQ